MTETASILQQLTPLVPLDLGACHTVSDIVHGMKSCSFGARMLGEVADTLVQWLDASEKPMLVFDGNPNKPLARLLERMCGLGWFRGPITTGSLRTAIMPSTRAVVVGSYTERYEEDLYRTFNEILFINAQQQCRPGQVQDGYFPNVVFADPTLVIPILMLTLRERLKGERAGVSDLMAELEHMDGVGKETVHASYTFSHMLNDPDCTVMLTLSGAMTIAKMQLLVADLLDTGRFSYMAATGALMAHGLVEGSGCVHYKHDPEIPDQILSDARLNRVTDTLEPEGNFDHIEHILSTVLKRMWKPEGVITSSSELHRELGRHLSQHHPEQRAILTSAFRRKIPIVTPAFVDSELANDVFVFNSIMRAGGNLPIVFDQERDTQILFDLARNAKRLGIFTIGGGVPRNNTQNVAPLIEVHNERRGIDRPPLPFTYGVRIDPASMAIGHLSGCTYSEGGTWRKFDLQNGQFAEVRADATIAWPFIQKSALERFNG